MHTSDKMITFSVYKKDGETLTPIEGWEDLTKVDDDRYTFNVTGGDQLVFEYRMHGAYYISSTTSAWVDSFAMDSSVRS